MTNTNTDDFNLPEEVKIPEEFNKIIDDFVSDIQLTFPEYNGINKEDKRVDRFWRNLKYK